MQKKLNLLFATLLIISLLGLAFASGCGRNTSTNVEESKLQEAMYEEAAAQLGMPSIKNFQEKRILKQILELRDQTNLVTYTYLVAEYTGKPIFLGQSIGYGVPASTQYTNPQKIVRDNGAALGVIDQADPNGLYSSTSEGTWILLKNPHGADVKPVYVEARIIVSPFPLE